MHNFSQQDFKKFGVFITLQSLSLVVYSLVYIAIAMLPSAKEISDTRSTIGVLNKSIDLYHDNIQALIWLPLLGAFARIFWSEKTKKLGDYFLLYSILVFFWHAISQLFLGSCILTIIPYELSQEFNIESNYEVYRWNPLGVPEPLLVPFYIFQALLSLWMVWKFIKILDK